ncbi:large subunit ribosomal protein L31e, partial [Trypanosoma cruzi]
MVCQRGVVTISSLKWFAPHSSQIKRASKRKKTKKKQSINQGKKLVSQDRNVCTDHTEARLLLRNLRCEVLEGGDGNVGDDGVEMLALASLKSLGLALHMHADTARNTLHALVPDVRVQRGVDAVVLSLHQPGN